MNKNIAIVVIILVFCTCLASCKNKETEMTQETTSTQSASIQDEIIATTSVTSETESTQQTETKQEITNTQPAQIKESVSEKNVTVSETVSSQKTDNKQTVETKETVGEEEASESVAEPTESMPVNDDKDDNYHETQGEVDAEFTEQETVAAAVPEADINFGSAGEED